MAQKARLLAVIVDEHFWCALNHLQVRALFVVLLLVARETLPALSPGWGLHLAF